MRTPAILLALIAVAGLVGGGVYASRDRLFVRDDPAVRACEAAVLSRIPTPSTYRRIGVDLTGATVTLEFDAQGLGGALERHTQECDFAETDGAFYFAGDASPRLASCIPDAKQEAADKHWAQATLDYLVAGCNREIADAMVNYSAPVFAAGLVYPISANETALR